MNLFSDAHIPLNIALLRTLLRLGPRLLQQSGVRRGDPLGITWVLRGGLRITGRADALKPTLLESYLKARKSADFSRAEGAVRFMPLLRARAHGSRQR